MTHGVFAGDEHTEQHEQEQPEAQVQDPSWLQHCGILVIVILVVEMAINVFVVDLA